MSTATEAEITEALERDRKRVADFLFEFINNPDGNLGREAKSTIAVLATAIQHGAHAK